MRKIKNNETKLQNYKLKNRERMRNARQTWRRLAEGIEKIFEEKRKNDRIRQRERRQHSSTRHLHDKNKPSLTKYFNKKLKVLEVLRKNIRLKETKI